MIAPIIDELAVEYKGKIKAVRLLMWGERESERAREKRGRAGARRDRRDDHHHLLSCIPHPLTLFPSPFPLSSFNSTS